MHPSLPTAVWGLWTRNWSCNEKFRLLLWKKGTDAAMAFLCFVLKLYWLIAAEDWCITSCRFQYIFNPQVLCCYGKHLCTIPRDASYWTYQNRYDFIHFRALLHGRYLTLSAVFLWQCYRQHCFFLIIQVPLYTYKCSRPISIHFFEKKIKEFSWVDHYLNSPYLWSWSWS